MNRPTITLFGDSITQMGYGEGKWVACLADAYTRKADVVNRGYSGFTTRTVAPLVDRVLDATHKRALVTVWLGANDAARNDLQHVPIAEYESNLTALLSKAKACSGAVIAISPPPVDSAKWPDRSNAVARAYGRAAKRAAAAAGVACLDAYECLKRGHEGTDGWKAHLNDGLHLSESGGAAIAAGILEVIATTFPAVAPEMLPLDAPEWRDVDVSAPDVSFAAHAASTSSAAASSE
jgi:lysophospholipase L1-like esterase